MPSTCVFEFDRPEPIYYSGETINSRIQLHTTSDKTVRSVYILFEGEGKVRWEEQKSRHHDGKTHHYTEYYRANETYLHTRSDVFGEGNLPLGTHTYTISIPLPLACPTSCVEKFGKISYTLSLIIDRPYKFDNVFNQPVTVIKQLDLNMTPEYLIPLKAEDVKYFCCWPCSSGPVLSTLTIPFGGYAPGQSIKFKLEIDNQSMSYDMHGYQLKLKQIYSFTAHTPHYKTRTHSNRLAMVSKSDRIHRLSKRIFEGLLTIPPVPPTSQPGGIITVHYIIKMEIDTGSCHSDAEMQTPITIGTIPLIQSATNPDSVILHPATAPGLTPDTPGSDLPPSYDICKPPSFEQATGIGDKFIDIDVDEHNRVDDFIPKYPMYTNFAVPTAPPSADATNGIDAVEAPLLRGPLQATPFSAAPPYPTHDANPSNMPQSPNSNIGWRH